ncbi:HEAT repeat domain-containing protein [Planctomyces sp. SH-PL62]|uniref:HEAT repeat domain-containing protein n=1 Tax=Planctomyces sp. SH-PL62 TaxID=1636152 RepID=UPI00078D07DD|nr:HEAT repeat domain-containing protein [Planctomyces sp. SH-PL62]AMV38941.1 HEAT repeat protein [Planctomyces sp. SH-PL62]
MRSPIGFAVLFALAVAVSEAAGAPDLPSAADGWAVELVGRTPEHFAPTTMAVGPGDLAFIGGRTRISGPGTPGVVLKADGAAITTFADGLNPVTGLAWVGDVLYIVHPPLLSAFRDADGDGRAERVEDVVTGLGPAEDQGAGALRRGMDGFLYLAIGSRGLAQARGKGGDPLRTSAGGVIRVRPDGSDLEIVSTGDARTSALAVGANDDLFALSDADDPRWGLRLIHHVAGGRYGYPRQFVAAEFRTLPAVARLEGRGAGQGTSYDEGRLPDEFRGNFVACEPEGQAVFRHELRKAGGGFALARRTPLATRGTLADFHPRAIAAGGDGFWIVDEASVRDGADGATGRIYRLAYVGDGLSSDAPRPRGDSIDSWVGALDHPARSVRLEAQDRLAAIGPPAIPAVVGRLGRDAPAVGRLHAIWALDAIGGDEARGAIRSLLSDESPQVRLQAARSAGLRRDRPAHDLLTKRLADRDPAVRREVAIALGRLGDRSAGPALLAALGDADRFAAWSIRRAILDLGCNDREALTAALLDLSRREAALLLADESWSVPLVASLVEALKKTAEPAVRGRILACLAAQYFRYPEAEGRSTGENPPGDMIPRKTENWDPEGMAAVLRGLEIGLKDADASVRYQAVFGLQTVGAAAGPLLREALPKETETDNQAALVEALGSLNDAASTRLLLPIVVDPTRPEPVRSAALDSLNTLRGRDVVRARLTVLYEEDAPGTLVAKALPALARDGFLPANDLAGFLHHASPLVRAAAVMSLNPSRPLPAEVKDVVLAKLDDEDPDVRRAAYLAAGPLHLREAVPRLVEKAKEVEGGDRTAVLNALCTLPDPRALSLYTAALDDPDPSLRRGAVRALLAIRDRVEPELRRTAREGEGSAGSALALDRILAKFEPVRGWNVLGPLGPRPPALMSREGAVDASRSYPGAAGGPIRWAPGAESGDGVVDLGPPGSKDATAPRPDPASTAAAYAEFTSTEARRAILLVEADGPIEVFLNGQPVRPPGSDAQDSPDHFAASLVAGVNRLVAISRPGVAAWRFVVSISIAPESPAH